MVILFYLLKNNLLPLNDCNCYRLYLILLGIQMDENDSSFTRNHLHFICSMIAITVTLYKILENISMENII